MLSVYKQLFFCFKSVRVRVRPQTPDCDMNRAGGRKESRRSLILKCLGNTSFVVFIQKNPPVKLHTVQAEVAVAVMTSVPFNLKNKS